MQWTTVLVVICLCVQLVVSERTQWLPYYELIRADGAIRLWQLSTLKGLDTLEQYTKLPSTAWNVAVIRDQLMKYECEEPDVVVFNGESSRVEDLLPSWYTLPLSSGWALEGFFWPESINGTVASSWADGAERWKLYLDDLGRLAFTWSESTEYENMEFKTCRSALSVRQGGWQHFAVQYDPSLAEDEDKIQFILDGELVANDASPYDHCGAIEQIVANSTVPLWLGATFVNGTYNEFFKGRMGKFALYHRAVDPARYYEHYVRSLPSTTGPCSGHGSCEAGVFLCNCEPNYYGENCSETIELYSIQPQAGSYFGSTQITITGKGFHAINKDSLHVRIGPTITDVDNFAGAYADYSGCTIVESTNERVVCDTEVQKGRSYQNVSVVLFEPDGIPADRPVFSTCKFTMDLEECYYKPDIDLTPRIWSYERWAVAGETLTFKGQNFLFGDFELNVGDNHRCVLRLDRPISETIFECMLPNETDIESGYYSMHLRMGPNGASFPMEYDLYIHSRNLTLYPFYPVEASIQSKCPTEGQTVRIYTSHYDQILKEGEIRVYDAPCVQRQVKDFYWVADKVPLDYWQTYGYGECPPVLQGLSSPLYTPSAFTLDDTLSNALFATTAKKDAVPRAGRRFVDHHGNSHCLFMEELK